MIRTLIERSAHSAVAVSGGMDSLLVLQRVREVDPSIDVLVFKTDFAPHQWQIIDNLIRLWDLTVIAPPPKASYLIPNGDQLARVDEYEVNVGVTLPVLRDVVHDDRCLLDLNQQFLQISPLDYDCIFVGTRLNDRSVATGQPIRKAITRVGGCSLVAPIFYWSDEQVREALKGLPYSREWYEEKDEKFDTGNLLACSRCVRSGSGEPVHCPKQGKVIRGHVWDQQRMLGSFREKFGFEVK